MDRVDLSHWLGVPRRWLRSSRDWLSQRRRRVSGPRLQWLALAGGPTAWFLAFLVLLFLTRGGCTAGIIWSRYLVLLAALLIALFSLFIAWRNTGSRQVEDQQGAAEQGLAVFGSSFALVLGHFSLAFLVILAVTTVALDACLFPSLSLGGEQ